MSRLVCSFGTDTLVGGYSYNSAPSVASVAPSDGPIAGGTSVTITGTGFTTTPDTTVTCGGTSAANMVVVNATMITCDTPAHASGAVDVVVTEYGLVDTRPLTPRQVELVRHLALGKTNRQLAKDLGVAEGTVRKHLEILYRNLGVNSRTEALARVARVATP